LSAEERVLSASAHLFFCSFVPRFSVLSSQFSVLDLKENTMTTFNKAALHEATMTLPGLYYTSDERFRTETERIFASGWVCVGRAEQIAAPGEYALIALAGESVIVVRDHEGTARAFFNVCRHRGTRLCTEEQGTFSGSIQCPYHAWTYGLDGRLLAARLMHGVDGFDKRDYGLHSAALAEWEGFLFLNLSPEPEPFESFFAPLIGKFSAWRLPELRVGSRIVYDVQANWKAIVQNYSECYHCPLVHPALVELSPADSGRNDLAEGPFLGGYMTLNHAGSSMTLDGATSRPPIRTVARDDLNRVYYYSMFPNMLLSLHADYVMVHTLRPESPNRTTIVCEWLFEPEMIAQPGFDPGDAVGFWDMTNRQDWHVCELTQQGVSSRAYTPGPYAHAEGLLAAFDRYYLGVMSL
jgi:Rieske 2Fe-2S family protein